jgi:hypothetical protein
MSREPRWRRYLRFWRRDHWSDVDEELRFHFEQRVAEYRAAGASAEAAASRAAAQFGDVDVVRDTLVRIDRRIARRDDAWRWLESLRDDLRQVMRSIARRPLVPAMAIAMLALAVGATAAAFAIVDPMFFRRPAGVADPASLRRLFYVRPHMARTQSGPAVMPLFAYAEYAAIRDATRGIARVAVDFAADSVDVEHAGQLDATGVSYVTSDFLPMLGVRIERGRTFSAAEDDVDDPANVAVVSHAFVHRTVSDSVDPLGERLRIRGRVYRVIGVTASGFNGLGLSETSVWLPLSTRAARDTSDGEPWYRRRAVAPWRAPSGPPRRTRTGSCIRRSRRRWSMRPLSPRRSSACAVPKAPRTKSAFSPASPASRHCCG